MMHEFSEQEIFLTKYYDDAVKTQVDYGVPLQVTLAQLAIETSWGKNLQGVILKESNTPGRGKKKKESSNGIQHSAETQYEGIKQHVLNLKKKYPVAFQYKHQPEEFIKSVQRDHEEKYSDDPSYARKVISVMALIRLLIKELKLNNQYKTGSKRR